MKLLAFVDTHEDPTVFARFREVIAEEKIDVACCAGDFTIFGRGTEAVLAEMNTLGVPVVLIHGNHEDEEEVVEALEGKENLHWAHGRIVDLVGVRFFGFGGHGFRKEEPELEELERQHAGEFTQNTIILSHAPPYGTTLDEAGPGWHVGNESLTGLLRRRRPMLLLCGHIHQCFHQRERVLKTLCINPGPDGEIVEVQL